MKRGTCRECGGTLQITGTDGEADDMDSNVLVECLDCGECYTVEPDGLGMGCEEQMIAMQVESGDIGPYTVEPTGEEEAA